MSGASTQANPQRGEAAIHVNGREVLLRPTTAEESAFLRNEGRGF